jgi:hypothetical protein
VCKNCGYEKINDHIALDPKYYIEFQYKSEGILDLIFKSQKLIQIKYKLETVLEKYAKFENPYFVNYVHMCGTLNSQDDVEEIREYTYSLLFKELLIKLGFDELNEYPQLHNKLVKTTALRFKYSDFISRIINYKSDDLEKTLSNWIEEIGSLYKTNIHFILYYFYQNNMFTEFIGFNSKDAIANSHSIMDDQALEIILNLCKNIHNDYCLCSE